MKKVKKPSIIGAIWKTTLDAIKKHPVILVPFCVSGILKLLFLLIVFSSFFLPLSIIFEPIIKKLWGEIYIHYPFNFSLIPKLFYYTQIAVYIFVDGLLSGMAVWMVAHIDEGQKPNLLDALKKVFPKYIVLSGFLLTVFLTVYLITYAENLAILQLLRIDFFATLMEKGILDFLKIFINFFIVVVVETGFAFAIPFVLLANRGFLKSIQRSFELARKLLPATIILIAIPTVLSLPFSLLKMRLPILMDKTFPEITLLVLGLGVLMTVIIDCAVTVSLAFLFLSRKDLTLEKAS